ncbi:hypothetical protein ACFQ6N_31935 [Kitasatospora sp. NPDC056446]|uniref:hypothetical protein n=1 Tax=Kitasatospora sp. NPDC056446 TaxID=3345819 RepID=UPI0036B8808A
MEVTMTEKLKPGAELTRREVHKTFGGRPQGAISPTKDNGILVFLSYRHDHNIDPNLPVNAQDGEGVLHLLGEGNDGDHQFAQSNKAVLDHKRTGRPIHVFEACTALYDGSLAEERFRYVGRYEIDYNEPYYLVDSPDKRGQDRRVIIFRLRPQPGVIHLSCVLSDSAAETHKTIPPRPSERMWQEASALARRPSAVVARESSVRREGVLLQSLGAHLANLGHTTTRLRLTTRDGSNTITTDLVDATSDTVYEVKSSVSREAVRSAIGYLLDLHRRPGAPANMAVLLPSDPLSDLRDLCAGLGIEVVWPNPDGTFTSTKS